MLKKGLKEHPQALKSDKFSRYFGIFWPNILDLSQSFVQYIAPRNCMLNEHFDGVIRIKNTFLDQ
jgi:hypothetical protein